MSYIQTPIRIVMFLKRKNFTLRYLIDDKLLISLNMHTYIYIYLYTNQKIGQESELSFFILMLHLIV